MNPIDVEGVLPTPQIARSDAGDVSTSGSVSFGEVLEDAISDVRGSLHEADKTAADALVGDAAPHEAMIALAKADLKFRLLAQTRNKLVNAYSELMNLRM